MVAAAQSEKFQSRVVEACAIGVGLLAIIALLSWRFDFWKLAALGSDYVPMAPSTAWLLLLLSGAIILSRRWPSSPVVRWFGMFAVAGTLLLGLLVWSRFLVGFELPLERWLSPVSSRVGNIPVGRMSPLTATAFLFTSLVFLCQLYSFERHRLWRQAASLFALTTLSISLVVLLSYVADAPVLYGGQSIPMALPTAISFCLLGVGLLLGSDPDTWPLSLFLTGTAPPSPSVFRGIAGGPLAAFLVLSLAIGITGALYLKKQIAHSRLAVHKELSAIAELKSGQIARWYTERQDDAQILFHNTLIQPQLRNYLNGSGSAPTADAIRKWMNYRQKKAFRRMILFDASGTPRLWAPSGDPLPRHDYRNEIHAALLADKVLTTDLYRDSSASDGQQQEINLNIWIPINGTGSVGPANGVLLLQIDPHRFLYPLIQTWPTPSSTAETLVVRKEGREVVYLNELRHRTETALSLRLPIDTTDTIDLPAAMAVKGRIGVAVGLDYRKVPVLAALCAIPGTPWFMVAKVDQEEVYAPHRQQAWRTGGIMLTLILAAALGVSLLWKQYDNHLLRRELALAQDRVRMEDELRRVNEELEQRVMDRTAQLQGANQELEAFAYSVSHDLRAPLRAMGGFSKALLEDFGDRLEGEAHDYLEEIIIGSRHMGQLIDGLLTLSRSTRGELRRDRMDLSLMADRIRGELEQSEPQRRVEWRIETGLSAHGDDRMIEVVMRNLLENAWKYTKKVAEPIIRVYGEAEGSERFFCVADNGAGFDMAHAGKLFQPFQRLHRQDEFSGIGIGLATAQRIVHRHGGAIQATGAPHRGATFRFSLPYGEEQENRC